MKRTCQLSGRIASYSPELIKRKIRNHLASGYHNVCIICTYTMRVDPRFRATTMLMWSTTSYAVARHAQCS